jgi:hypothetical protein
MNHDNATNATTRPVFCAGCDRVAIADIPVTARGEHRHWAIDQADENRFVWVASSGWGKVDVVAISVPGGVRTKSGTAPIDSFGRPILYCPDCLASFCLRVG